LTPKDYAMARCAANGCQRWCLEVIARHGLGTSIDGHWFCSAGCVEKTARRRLQAPRPAAATGIPAMPPPRLGVLLRHAGAVSAADLARALEAQGQSGLRLGAQLRRMGIADSATVLRALAKQAGVSYVAAIDPLCVRDAPGRLSRHAIRALNLVPFGEPERERIRVAVVPPVPRAALNALRQLTGWTPDPYLVDDEQWLALLENYGAGVAGQPTPGPIVELIEAHSLSDAAARIAAAATSARRTTVTEAHWEPYTWIRVEGNGVARDVLLTHDKNEETLCLAANTSH
jgi:type II secretion system (T2SS) protein E